MTLFLCSVGVQLLTIAILCPVISKVNLARMKVLCLFVDIPSYHVVNLATKCENFISSFHEEEEKGDDMESDSEEKLDDTSSSLNNKSKRVIHKQPKNSNRSNTKVFIQFLMASFCVMAYFITMFVLAVQFIGNITILAEELNILA